MSEPLLLRGGSVVTAAGIRATTDVRIERGRIAELGTDLSAAGARIIDTSGCWVTPGFVDLHVHGADGAMFEAGSSKAVETISRALAAYGVTGVLATLATLPTDDLRIAVETITGVVGREPGARILGIHLEGPFLNPIRCGAQAAAWMREPSIAEIDDLQQRSGGLIRMVTLAPELPGALELIRWLRAHEIGVAIGHTAATEAQAAAAVAAGARHVTHLYNAMDPPHHRSPGVVGTALTTDVLSIELICDGHHVHPRFVDVALRCKPKGQVVLVSDAVAALGREDGTTDLFGAACVIRGGAVRLAEGGQLAGSCLSLAQAVRNLVRWQPSRPLEEILAMVTCWPARIAGVGNDAGAIRVGRSADIVLLTAALEVVATIGRGEILWSAEVGAENCG